jgi:FixJ family two-component response regulator
MELALNPYNVRVAVVEDDPSIGQAVTRLLCSVGFDVSLFASAEEFLVRVDQSHPTCVLADVHLPRLSGLELAAVLRELDRQLPFVFITADRSVAESDAMLRSGATCLTKPFEDDRLLNALVQASAPA